MFNEREALIKFCTSFQPSPQVVAQILELGIIKHLDKNRSQFQNFNIKSANIKISNTIKCVTYLDEDWPKQLFDLDDEMPLVMWFRGDLSAVGNLIAPIAITGTRQPSITDVRYLGQLIAASSQLQLPLITDGASGSGELLLQVGIKSNSKLILVKAAGLETKSKSELNLLPNVLELSEFPPKTPLSKPRILQRNRIIAALSSLTIAVRPKTFSTASSIWHWADQLGRDRFLI